ncbi:hypothetical protein KCU91_g76, partial [Aureobasidium melanogenum]
MTSQLVLHTTPILICKASDDRTNHRSIQRPNTPDAKRKRPILFHDNIINRPRSIRHQTRRRKRSKETRNQQTLDILRQSTRQNQQNENRSREDVYRTASISVSQPGITHCKNNQTFICHTPIPWIFRIVFGPLSVTPVVVGFISVYSVSGAKPE